MWTAFGVVAFLGDVGIHRVVEPWAWLEDRPWLIAGSALLLAGTFQFSDLKDRCLKECRHPGPFLMSRHRRGGGERGVVPIGIGLLTLAALVLAHPAWLPSVPRRALSAA